MIFSHHVNLPNRLHLRTFIKVIIRQGGKKFLFENCSTTVKHVCHIQLVIWKKIVTINQTMHTFLQHYPSSPSHIRTFVMWCNHDLWWVFGVWFNTVSIHHLICAYAGRKDQNRTNTNFKLLLASSSQVQSFYLCMISYDGVSTPSHTHNHIKFVHSPMLSVS